MALILVVDDDADSREGLVGLLRLAGHEVIDAPNGRQAMNAVLAQMPDLLLLDLVMPEMNGADLLETLNSYLRLKSIPVVVLTGAPYSRLAERARRIRPNSLLVKSSATFGDIVTMVNRELGAHPA